ncbi:MAG: hypothetical protein F8N36_12015 [Desulfovibrio sp.]|uniref:hypothetical protein n=1 Tax=Desulfovibrio sp. TaxID=885 RepID=UPI00135D12FD|nr:hypothetical protein [Desulfovibrio sp.]MTJ93573.1 hypothetical protein [Desulfovibrio sp.]
MTLIDDLGAHNFDDAADLIGQLADVAAGRVRHIYRGACPDDLEGDKLRDADCPACRALIAADQAMGVTDAKIL